MKKENNDCIYLFVAKLSMALLVLVVALSAAGCSGDDPDTSAPQRTVIDRTPDWQGALLYIADENGPVPGWGSVRVYDNVSGFVEKTVEQTAAAGPADVYVTRDGGSMYVAGAENGRIDKFRWDGNNWNRGGVTLELPVTSISAVMPGPDGKLYVAANGGDRQGQLFRLDLITDRVEDQPVPFASLLDVQGAAWSPDGSTVYLSGRSPQGQWRLCSASWPSLSAERCLDLPETTGASKPVVTVDGRSVLIMAPERVLMIDPASMTVRGTFAPSGNPATMYSDGALSVDGNFLFVTGKAAGQFSTLYVVSLADNTTVHTVKNISDTARGIQRVE